MLLIIFWGLIAKLAFVSGNCDLGTTDENDFNFGNLGISVLTQFLKEAAFKTTGCVCILFVIPLKNSQ